MTGIIGMTDLLLETPLTEEQRSYVDMGRMCAKSLLAILDSTLELSALTAGRLDLEKSEFALPETLMAAVESYRQAAESKGLRLSCRLDPSLPAVAVGDAPRLQRLLVHLLDNAVKFTHRGYVEVHTAGRSDGDGVFRLLLNVQDTGVGIAQDQLEKIFESFTQLESGFARSYNGLGLGLAIASRLAPLMGGSITVESAPGAGSRFSVEVALGLPASASEDASFAYRDSAAASPGARNILVVEDNPVGRTVVTHMLERAGYRVTCAAGGEAAVSMAATGNYDLILMDLHMPEIDGFEAARRIRALPGRGHVPILALSADVTDEVRRRCQDGCMDAFIPKPVQSDELLAMLAQFLP